MQQRHLLWTFLDLTKLWASNFWAIAKMSADISRDASTNAETFRPSLYVTAAILPNEARQVGPISYGLAARPHSARDYRQ